MAITYGFFPYLVGSSPHDRSYTTILWAQFFKWLFPGEGVVASEGNELAVTATGGTPDMYVHVDTGTMISSGFYWLKNSASYPLQIADADGTNPRKDIVVARFRLTGDAYRDAILAVKTGVAAASPTAPTCTHDTDTYEIELAEIAVGAGVTQILTANITDKRTSSVGGWLWARIGKWTIDAATGDLKSNGFAIQMGTAKITGLGDPTAAQDAATKNYVDNNAGMAWTEVTGTSQSAAVNHGYICNNGSLVTVTLPATAAVGQEVAIVGKGGGKWKLAQNSGQTINFVDVATTTGTGGYISANARYDCIKVICITANTTWVVTSSIGILAVT